MDYADAFQSEDDLRNVVTRAVLIAGCVIVWCVFHKMRKSGWEQRPDLRPQRRLLRLLLLGGLSLCFAVLAAFFYNYTGPAERFTAPSSLFSPFGILAVSDRGFGVAPLHVDYNTANLQGQYHVVFVGSRVRFGFVEFRNAPRFLPQLA